MRFASLFPTTGLVASSSAPRTGVSSGEATATDPIAQTGQAVIGFFDAASGKNILDGAVHLRSEITEALDAWAVGVHLLAFESRDYYERVFAPIMLREVPMVVLRLGFNVPGQGVRWYA